MSKTERPVAITSAGWVADLERELPPILTEEALEGLLGVSRTTLWRAIKRGELERLRGRTVRVSRASVVRYLGGA